MEKDKEVEERQRGRQVERETEKGEGVISIIA